MNVLFLYTELADYFIACCNELAKSANVHIVRWPVNKEAPFRFHFSSGIKVYEKNEYTRKQLGALIKQIGPDIIVCSGWIDKDYLNVVKPWYGKTPTVLTCDTHWNGSPRQLLATLLSRFFLKNRFSNIWVPGAPQFLYAQKLGFNIGKISTGFYSCDLPRFNSIFEKYHKEKTKQFPKILIYSGRYFDFKGITDLWEAFIELTNETDHTWELWCLGKGSVAPVQHSRIKHFGFVQPSELEPLIAQAGVFVLPSRFEPWGVVVQEFAAAGFPLVLSDAVGAGGTFLQESKNGFIFPKENKAALKETLKKVLSLKNDELAAMANQSHNLAQRISPGSWVETLNKILNEHK
jgi:glycosyltransferase involved in cell wall biosynthesis